MFIETKYEVERAISDDEARPGISTGAWYDAAEKSVIATDGHMLAKVPVNPTDHFDHEGYVTKEALTEARRQAKKARLAESTIKANGSLTLANGASLPRPQRDTCCGVSFPDWRIVKQGAERGELVCEVSLDARLLLDLAKAIGATGGVTLTVRGDGTGAILVRPNQKENDAEGLLMPQWNVRS